MTRISKDKYQVRGITLFMISENIQFDTMYSILFMFVNHMCNVYVMQTTSFPVVPVSR